MKQEIMDSSNQSEEYHSGSPSSSSRDSSDDQQPTNFRLLTPPNYDQSQEDLRNEAGQTMSNTVTPPKSPSQSPPWVSNPGSAPLSPNDSAENDDEPGVRLPAVNSHGKVKTHKCKQCEFVAVTKIDFWEHSRVHIKPERMLACQKCPFVTEYKHHLEYHMRNHFGSKPFNCTQCSYSCVNKSMLNSHLKSHSNIYQYRCSDCNYATKYCHSLKLHLRKYTHNPAMVLNQDGTPNPLPIIDVYGTRRGPKQKTQMKIQEENSNQGQNLPTVPPHPHSIFTGPFPFTYSPLLQQSLLFPPNNNLNDTPPIQSPKREEDRHLGIIQPVSPQVLLQPRFLPEYNQNVPPSFASPISPYQNRAPPSESPVENGANALDLTNNRHEAAPSTPTLRSRRKGRAFKRIKTEIVDDDDDDGTTEAVMQNLNDNQVEEIEVSVDVPKFTYDSDDNRDKQDNGHEEMDSEPSPSHSSPSTSTAATTTTTAATGETKKQESFDCTYCDIIFKDLVMYTMHMGYHGFKDPFECNMCGDKCNDKISFFIHVARVKHS